ncbi:MAG TPA: MMPL family transporter, partial [Ilumatobacter sp.]|nr:MMPL family transporter [Ilumatobacter sp.]
MAQPSIQGTSVTARIAAWSERHRWRVVGAWMLILIAAVVTSSLVATDTDTDVEPPGEAGEAAQLFDERFGTAQESAREVVVFSHPELRFDEAPYQQKVEGLMSNLRALRSTQVSDANGIIVTSSERVVASTLTAYDVGLPREQSPFVASTSSGGDVSFAIVTLVGDDDEAEHTVDAVIDTVDRAGGADEFEIAVGGDASIASESNRVVEEDFALALQLNLPITLLLLLLAFGALVAAFIPLGLALIAITIALAVLSLVSRLYPLEELYSEMVLLIGLATGIDYTLFIITRYRLERAAGHPKERAIVLASGTSGKSVVFAGVTVLLAISGMFLVDNVIFSSMAIAAIVVVAIAVIISVTLLPAILAILGDNVNRWRLGFLRRRHTETGGIWGRISDYVLAHPVAITMVTLVVLLALALPVTTFNLGFNGNKALPDAVDAKKALTALEANFTLGLTSPAIVLIDPGQDQNIFGSEIQANTDEFLGLVDEETASATNSDAPYGSPIQTEVNDSGNTELIRIPINADTGDDEAIRAVEHLRDDLVPQAFPDQPPNVLVTGDTAGNIDFRKNILAKTPLVIAYVVALTFITLLIVFRSIVIPIKAVV